MNEKKSLVVPIILFSILFLFSLSVVFMLFSKQLFRSDDSNKKNEEVFCTADAMQCPDGSYVGRSGPNCEFTICPETQENSNFGFLEDVDAGDMGFGGNLEWQEFVQDGLNFRAPKEIVGLNFVKFTEWTPKVVVLEESYVCDELEYVINRSVVEKEINGRIYCIDTSLEGAAGSSFTDYSYTTSLGEGNIVKVDFTVQFPQCMNYDSPQSEDCTLEEKDFSMDRVVDVIVESVAEPALEI